MPCLRLLSAQSNQGNNPGGTSGIIMPNTSIIPIVRKKTHPGNRPWWVFAQEPPDSQGASGAKWQRIEPAEIDPTTKANPTIQGDWPFVLINAEADNLTGC